jgi:uncharacterized protein (TIGR02001 family)
MRHTLTALTFAAACGLPALACAQAAPAAQSPHTFTGNFGLYSEYRFRAIAQTFGKPALQGGIDYAHSSGLYLGNWNSNVSEGAGYPASNLEMDFYGGWKKTWGDWGLDLGGIYYSYPGSDANRAAGTAIVNPRAGGGTHTGSVTNKELYLGGAWKFLSLKYYHATGDYFSQPGTQGSHYFDLAATYELGHGWGLNGHLGSFRLKNWSTGTDATNADYIDWKLGVTKDISGWLLAASYLGTNGKGSCDQANPGYYCFANKLPYVAAAATRNAAGGTLLFSVGKTF